MSRQEEAVDGASLPSFSLIVPTVGRTAELMRLLESLRDQTYRRFEVIVVDQNADDRVANVIAKSATGLPIIHLRSEPGASTARNAGLSHATGDVIGYPDDDCWYPPELLQETARFLAVRAQDGVGGKEVDAAGFSPNEWDSAAGPITRFNAWGRAKGFSFFLRRHVVEAVGPFDERLGPGSGTPWGAGEDTDYIIRAVKKGFRIWYMPSLIIHHPFHPYAHRFGTQQWIERGYSYGRAMGLVMRKHNYPLWFAAYYWFRPLAGSVVEMIRRGPQGPRYHLNVFSGRVRGWLDKSRAEASGASSQG
jgi:glycosyltransferase involved in cell wall biosynthesis